jgi:hypothetical protein
MPRVFFAVLMDPRKLYYRRKFNNALAPIKVMLVEKKRRLTLATWISFVNQTRDRVLVSPQQYLGEPLPPSELMITIINDIFRDFVKAEA